MSDTMPERERDARRERKVGMEECEKREAALRADLKALVPLAGLGLVLLEADDRMQHLFPVTIGLEAMAIARKGLDLAAARAILDREGV